MHRGAQQLHAVFQGLLVDTKSVAAGTDKGGDQGGVDVQNERDQGEGLYISLGEDDHETGQHHQVDVQRLELLHQSRGHGLAGGVGKLPGHHIGGNVRLLGTLQGVGVGVRGDDSGNLAVHDLTPGLGVDQGLKVGAAAEPAPAMRFAMGAPPDQLHPASPETPTLADLIGLLTGSLQEDLQGLGCLLAGRAGFMPMPC